MGKEGLGKGVRELSEASELMRERGREREREREDLNTVGPKVVETGSTGQTGCFSRSDRLPQPVRPVWPG